MTSDPERIRADTAPIIDVHAAADGTNTRFVARLPIQTSPPHSKSAARATPWTTTTTLRSRSTPPGGAATFDITAQNLPAEPTPIPCQVEQ